MADDTFVEITRRGFLASTVAAGTAMTFAGCQVVPAGSSEKSFDVAPSHGNVQSFELVVNGRTIAIQAEPRTSLLDLLRENVGLTGTKKGCDHGQCGACTVLVNGERKLSCLTLAISAVGDQIVTIEGLTKGEELHPMQAAFIEYDAFQCGYCTPGQICSAVGLVHEAHATSDADIREQMSGNICRCGAYPNIVKAVRHVMDNT